MDDHGQVGDVSLQGPDSSLQLLLGHGLDAVDQVSQAWKATKEQSEDILRRNQDSNPELPGYNKSEVWILH